MSVWQLGHHEHRPSGVWWQLGRHGRRPESTLVNRRKHVCFEEMALISLRSRIISLVTPAVVTLRVWTPVLAVIFYASRTARLAGNFRGGAQASLHDTLT